MEAQTVAFNITENDEDDDDDFMDMVSLEDLRNHTKIQVIQTLLTEHNMCAVCHAEYELNDVVRELRCNHKFHQACVDRVLEDSVTCPMCRHRVVPDDEDDIDDEDVDD